MSSEVEQLIAAGNHAQAARLLEERGELARAQQLREAIWDWQGAAELARRRGDVIDELRLRLEAGDQPRLGELLPLLPQLDDEAQARAEALLERRQLYWEAADLADRRGALAAAERLYLLAQRPLDAARIAERRGDLRRSGGLLEALLRDATATPAELLAARSELARIHASLGRYDDALALLQPSGAEEPTVDRSALDRQRVHYFYRLGMSRAAQAVLTRARDRAATPTTLATLDEVLEIVEVEQARERRQRPELVAGRYRVLEYLGAGAVGRVYLAHDEVADRRVALKLVPPPVDERLKAGYLQFLREVKILDQLHHPGLVACFDIDENNGLLCTEYLDGGSLADRPLPLEPATCRQILDEVLDALGVVHAHDLVHRDLKPANLLIAPSGRIKIGDFGAAHLRGHGVTQTAGFVGTLGFMSPEQIRGEAPTFAVDLYGAGCTLYQLLTGALPFAGPDYAAQHLAQPPPRPSQVDPKLAAWDPIITRALAKRPADRYPSALAMRRAVQAVAVEAGAQPQLLAPPSAPAPGTAGTADATRLLQPLPTERGPLFAALDERIGRPLEVELLPSDDADREAWRRWLVPLAGGAPILQRIFSLDADRVRFEAIEGEPIETLEAIDASTASAIASALEPLWASGRTHGSIGASLRRTRTGPVLRLAGVAASRISVDEERSIIRRLQRGESQRAE